MATTDPGYIPYDPALSAAQNSTNMVNNQNQNYNQFMANLPQYQGILNNQTIDNGAKNYNQAKDTIDTQANSRGLLFSGLKQEAEAGAANTAAKETQTGIAGNNANIQNYATGLGNQTAQSNIANQQGIVSGALNQYGQGLQQSAQQSQQQGQMLGGLMAVGGMAAFSDENLKDDVKNADKDADDMVGSLKAKTYSYKDDPKKEKRLGILAQDLEKSPMGKAMVIETPKGKAFDMAKALSAVLAVQATLDKRLKKKGA